MKKGSLHQRIRNRLLRIRLRPIRVFCFHQVSDTFDPVTMWKSDWISTATFKQHILALKEEGCCFVSLEEARFHMKHDFIRTKRYVVLTADDGSATVKNILPWLAEQKIPLTLFVNPLYMDGEHYRESNTEQYLTVKELMDLSKVFRGLTIASHGWNHADVTTLSETDFIENVENSLLVLKVLPCFIPYHAYAFGRHNRKTDKILAGFGLIPVLMDGMKNYSDTRFVHRELLID